MVGEFRTPGSVDDRTAAPPDIVGDEGFGELLSVTTRAKHQLDLDAN